MTDGDTAPFEALGSRRFQRFCQSLLSYEFPYLQAPPVGQPDGGRDAWVSREDGGGVVVFQVKFVERPDYLKDPGGWLRKTLASELPKVRGLVERGATRYVLLTNAPGSAHLDVGSVDIGQAVLDELLPISGQVWWRNDLVVRLAKHRELKWAYRELLTGQDVLDQLVRSHLSEDRSRRRDVIAASLAAQFAAERMVRFKQVELQNALFDLFVDVPLSAETVYEDAPQKASAHGSLSPVETWASSVTSGHELHFHGHGMSRPAGRVLKGVRGPAAAMFLDPDRALGTHERWIVEAAPGQGKSTLAQYLCQVHRLLLIGRPQDAPGIWHRHREAPTRLPFKVDSRELATFLNGRDPFETVPGWSGISRRWPRSLEGFLALQVRRYSGGARFDVSDLLAVARSGPLLLVLDGLDEVADTLDRRAIMDLVRAGLHTLEASSSSVQTLVTSRPGAVPQAEDPSELSFRYARLDALEPDLVVTYARRWVTASRLVEEEAADVMRILRARLDAPHVRELARNPMQLAILLALINTKGESLPDRRTELYLQYMTLFFDREAAKSRIVRAHRTLLFGLHGELAWRLHSAARSGRGTIALAELKAFVRDYVERQGADVGLTDELFQGVVERIVAIVATQQERFEFEVQPVREFFAAHHLYATSQVSQFGVRRPGTRADRFAALARSEFWTNVLRFFAGFYTSGELPSLADGLEALASDPRFAKTAVPRIVAVSLLADWTFELDLQSRMRAIEVALDGLGTRHALGVPNSSTGSAQGLMSLPEGAGRDSTETRACALLGDPALAPDRADALISVLAAHLDRTRFAFAGRWSKLAREASGRARTRWVRVGLRSAAADMVPDAVLDAIVCGDDDAAELPHRVEELLDAGRADMLEGCPDRSHMAMELMLWGKGLTMDMPEAESSSWLGVLQAGLRLALRQPERPLPPSMSGVPPAPPHLQLCEDVAAALRGMADCDEATVKSGAGWMHIAECCARAHPQAPLPIVILVRVVRRWKRPGIAGPPVPPGQRLGGALDRVMAAAVDSFDDTWWSRHFSAANSGFERQVAVLCALGFLSGNALRMVLDQLAACLDELSPEELAFTAWAVHEISSGGKDLLRLPKPALQALTPRLAMVLSIRDERSRTAIWRSTLRAYVGDEPPILSHVAAMSLRAATQASEDDELALAHVRQAHRAGLTVESSWHLTGVVERHAQAVVTSPHDYPLEAVLAAEFACQAVVERQQPSLADIAQRDGWFRRER